MKFIEVPQVNPRPGERILQEVNDSGQPTGFAKIEKQLAGNQIFSVEGQIRKEAWAPVDASSITPGVDPATDSTVGNLTTPAAKPAQAQQEKKHK